jgi:hypothetical protein
LLAASHPGTTQATATPIASKTTQYPKPVSPNDPICCPVTHSHAPSINWPIAQPSATRDDVGTTGGSFGAMLVCWSSCVEKDVLMGAADWGNGEMGAQGDTGVGVGCVCNSAGGTSVAFCEPGSRNEKKLWDRECL